MCYWRKNWLRCDVVWMYGGKRKISDQNEGCHFLFIYCVSCPNMFRYLTKVPRRFWIPITIVIWRLVALFPIASHFFSTMTSNFKWAISLVFSRVTATRPYKPLIFTFSMSRSLMLPTAKSWWGPSVNGIYEKGNEKQLIVKNWTSDDAVHAIQPV